jgi:hypothetical protein
MENVTRSMLSVLTGAKYSKFDNKMYTSIEIAGSRNVLEKLASLGLLTQPDDSNAPYPHFKGRYHLTDHGTVLRFNASHNAHLVYKD